ncbi:MAG: hypothetical protein AAFR11_10860 [Pseudomonadota bacterium]
MARFLSIVGAAGLAACAGNGAVVTIETTPPAVEVTLKDGRYCMSPCSLRMREPTEIKLTKTGYKTRTIAITPSPLNMASTLAYELELISASKPVEETGLPTLPPATVPELSPEPAPPTETADGLTMEPIGPRSQPPAPDDEPARDDADDGAPENDQS